MTTLAQLTSHLAALTDASLTQFLVQRPELLKPPAADFSALAARASSRSSLSRALELLNAPELQTLTVLVVLESATVVEICLALTDAPPYSVTQILQRLVELGLVIPTSSRMDTDTGASPVSDAKSPSKDHLGTEKFIPLSPLREVLGAHAAGLGRSRAELVALSPDSAAIPSPRLDSLTALLSDAPAGATRILAALDTYPVGIVNKTQRVTVDWLLARGLLFSLDSTHVELPREVALALRGNKIFTSFARQPPATTSIPVVACTVRENASHHAIAGSVRTMTALLQAVVKNPLPTLRAGGVGVRPVLAFAKELELDVAAVSFYLELASMAALLTLDPDTSHWRCSVGNWAELPREQQWLWLVNAWLCADRLPALVGTGSPVVTVLGAGTFRPEASAARTSTLLLLATLERRTRTSTQSKDEALAPTPQDIIEHFAWHHPRLGRRLPSMLPGFLAEAEQLGLTGAGALSHVAQLIAQDQWKAALEAVKDVLPAPVSHLFIQSDLSAIVPGYLEPELSSELSLTADPEGKGAAGIYRFSEMSIARALDAGRTGLQIIDFLRQHSMTSLPQSLEYLIRDVASRHGRLTLGAAGSFIKASTAQLLTEFLALPVAEELGFVSLADTVAATHADPRLVARALAKADVRVATAQGSFALDGPAAITAVVPGTRSQKRPSQKRHFVESEQVIPQALRQLLAASAPSSETKADADVVLDPFDSEVLEEPPSILDLAQVQLQVLRSNAEAGDEAGGGSGGSQQAHAFEKLRQALRESSAVWLSTAASDGTRRRQKVVPIKLAGGSLQLRESDGSQRTQSFHRIIDVDLVEES